MLAASGLKDEVLSIFNWYLPSLSMKCVNMKKSSQWSIGSLKDPRILVPSCAFLSRSFAASLTPCSPKKVQSRYAICHPCLCSSHMILSADFLSYSVGAVSRRWFCCSTLANSVSPCTLTMVMIASVMFCCGICILRFHFGIPSKSPNSISLPAVSQSNLMSNL